MKVKLEDWNEIQRKLKSQLCILSFFFFKYFVNIIFFFMLKKLVDS